MARYDHVHARCQPIDHALDRPSQVFAARWIGLTRSITALMDQHDDHVGPGGAQARRLGIDGVSFVRKSQPLDPVGRDEAWRAFQSEADEAHFDRAAPLAKGLNPGGREQRAAIGAAGTGGEVAIFCPAEWLDLAGLLRGKLGAAARLLAQQFVGSAVKFVIANRSEIETDPVEYANSRFIKEQRRGNLRGAGHVASRNRC